MNDETISVSLTEDQLDYLIETLEIDMKKVFPILTEGRKALVALLSSAKDQFPHNGDA